MPLILSRKRGEAIEADGPCLIRILEHSETGVKLEVIAVPHVKIAFKKSPTTAKKAGGKWRYPKKGAS